MANNRASDDVAPRDGGSGRIPSEQRSSIEKKSSTASKSSIGFRNPTTRSFGRAMDNFMANMEMDNEQHPPPTADPVGRFVTQRRFEVFITCAILVNALQMGIGVQIGAMGLTSGPFDTAVLVLEHVFTAIFAVEMCLKIYAFRCGYFFDGWNLLDFFLVSVSIIDNWLMMLIATDDLDNLTVLRLIRLFRVFRMIKVVKVKRELLVLVEGIVASIRAMVPIMTLLFLVVYAFSILCVEIIGKEDSRYTDIAYLEENDLIGKAGLPWDNHSYFGTLPQAWLTLFNIAVLSEWPEIIRPVFQIQNFFVPILMCFVMVTAFGIINVIIGVIVEQTEESARQSLLANEEHEKQEQMKNIGDMARLICELDGDNDGLVSPAEFKNPDMMQLFEGIHLPHGFDSEELYIMLDRDGSGEVTIDEFMMGMHRIIYCNDFQRVCLAQMNTNMVKKFIIEHRRSTAKAFQHMEEHISKEVSVLRADFSKLIQDTVSHIISTHGSPTESQDAGPKVHTSMQAPCTAAVSQAPFKETALVPPANASWPASGVATLAPTASQSSLRTFEMPAMPQDLAAASRSRSMESSPGRQAIQEECPLSSSRLARKNSPQLGQPAAVTGKGRLTGPPLYYPPSERPGAIVEERAACAPAAASVGLLGVSQLARGGDPSRPFSGSGSQLEGLSDGLAHRNVSWAPV